MTKLAAVASALLMASKVAALDPIIVKGSKFFYENGTQFFMKGIAYQEDPAGAGGENEEGRYLDPLADKEKCERDVPILASAHTNTIRVYSIDPERNHDDCMKLLQDAGIYVVADLGEPLMSINRDGPQWTVDHFQRYKDVIDVLAEYDNTIGFFAGNEVSNNKTNTAASAFVKAAVRDTKAYIRETKDRWLGVGYAANDDPDIRGPSAHYFNCGDQDSAIDFWGYNIYSWCGQSSLQRSGYDQQVAFYSNYSVPVFLAEYGCNEPGGAEGRLFQDTTALYSDDMSEVFSGGIVYMYFQEENDYGLVEIDRNGNAETMENYDVYSSRVAAATPSSTLADDYEPTNSPASCPPLQEHWRVTSDALPPTPDDDLCECMVSTLSCVPESNIRPREMQAIFDFICSEDPAACAGITTNTETGVYGAYSMCDDRQKVAFVMNEYYHNLDEASDACDHEGLGVVRSAPGADSTCSSGLASASSQNEYAATATQAPASSGSAGDDDEDDDDENFGLVSKRLDMAFTLGDYAVGLYLVVAGGVGAAMVVL
ncbi:1,3-beta-glucanosyltransferase gel4 [Sodiomyces alkalinus F11]|uniref:1,3-beta-glucanosyltransferase n=1 Tax=Sodiomyces alkalinus (strain CBS 110278 / VKM F-3762 / F11) TaxID=1314773 RepID=A0A3N2PIW5_SODAK|nr:1,3-beta-glucanosyltransferase gel4 [Sodiomyces alkalinus F11]ROT34497.1 1,3-beta-glucanosyltransferase gel4 [Sodiomyces alkalinus F11]